ncbi:protein KTI12 homolog isoform X2 [Cherax quadricarinatus]
MPLLLVSGFPSSGKTTRTLQIKTYLEKEKNKNVVVVSENNLLGEGKNEVFRDSRREKDIRGALKADVIRLLNKEDVVILDAANYIKGYRWDSPMFTILPEDAPPYEFIYDALYLCKPPPPNQSTQTQPLSSTNFLFELDRTTQEVTSCIMSAQKIMVAGDNIKVPGVEETVCFGHKVTLAEITRARRQFISYTKMHPVEDASKLMALFVRYLNSTLG